MFKSIKTGVIAFILLSTAALAQAQKKIEQGTVTYAVSYELTPEQKSSFDESMLPTESVLEFNNNLARIQMDLGAALVKVISDANTKTALVLVDVPMAQKQFATKMSAEEVAKERGDIKYSNFKPTGQKQTIAGYNAEKYTYTDNKNANYELWLTKDVRLAKGAEYEDFAPLNGTPVKYAMTANGVKSIYTLKSIKESTVANLSMEVPAGYELKTAAEMKAMQGGGQ
ncbi:DUF4412 domain-containing protein [Pedobacter sp. SAFR-022]|uniref:DUF4412 domain-containing protein n=1 Tax=Pedobacter sp. SAFR-022 TaxID=3436861 RepID=UPI003F7EF990